MLRILLADDEELERRALRLILQEGGEELELIEAANGREAVEAARSAPLDAAFLDICMPGIGGIEAARLIREARPDAPIVFLTAYDSFAYAREALRINVDEYLLKPASSEEVRSALDRALRNGRSRRAASDYLARGLRAALGAGSLSEAAWEEYRSLAWPGPGGAAPRLALAFRLEREGRAAPAGREAAELARAAGLAERLLAARGLRALAGSGPERGLAFAQAEGPAAGPEPAALLAELRERARADLGLSLLAGASACPGPSSPAGPEGPAPAEGPSAAALCRAALEAASMARPERPLVLTRCRPEEGPEAAAGRRPGRAVERAKAIIEERLGEELSLESVAAELRLSPSHLSRLFSLEAGAGFGDCLARARVDRAKGLLDAGHSVKEASLLVGIRDPANFARVFRRLEGASPGEYRERASARGGPR
ncbi:MAG TPA: response regulator [Spirochaetia bacterium]|nr:response regulator [Spirochaetia bacterium]HRZ64395.1 response regulator [Spirochaetia bacterium]